MPNKLPLNWCECKFEDVLDYEQPTKYIVESTDYQEHGTPVLTAGKSFILGYTNEKEGIFDASKEPVIIFDDFTTASKIVKFPFKVKSSAMKILHPKININIDYIYYLMQTIHYKSDTHKRYWISEYAKQSIALPPLAEQERIVEKIETLFADIDEGIENLKTAQTQIKQYRQSVLKSAFEGKLYKTTDWKEVQLKDVCASITDGDHQAPPKAIKGIPFIMISDIRDHKINLDTNNFVTEDYYNNISENRKAHKGDILYSVVGSYGIATLVNITDKFCFQRHIALIKVNIKNITSHFLYHLMNSNNIYKQATICSTGTAQKTVPLSGLRNFSFLLPTLPEQQRIVEEIEKRFAIADELEKAVNDGLEKAEKLKQSILKKAFVGKLVSQDPNDEPASILLERIKKETQSQTKGKIKCLTNNKSNF